MLIALASVALAATPTDAVRAAVAARAQVPVADVEVGPLGLLPAVAALDTDWEVRFPGDAAFRGSTAVQLTGGGRSYALRPHVITWREVPVAAESVRAGDAVVLTVARVASDRLKSETPVAAGAWQARVALAAGEPVTTARVRPLPDLRNGAEVKVLAGSGGLQVRAPGKLMEDAFVGAPVAVLNLATKAVQRGTYRGDGTVALETP